MPTADEIRDFGIDSVRVDDQGILQPRCVEAKQELMQALGVITKDNGYTVEIRGVSGKLLDLTKLTSFPQVAVILGDEVTKGSDQRWLITNAEIDVMIIGYVQSETSPDPKLTDAAEILIRDIKQILRTKFIANVNHSTNKWVFDLNKKPLRVSRVFDLWENKGMFTIQFGILIKSQDGAF